MASQSERKAATRRKLIAAAKLLFEEHGYDAVSVDQIVQAANVAKGTFYQHYETKLDILTDLTRDEGEARFKTALDAVRQGASAIATLHRFIEIQCAWFEQHQHIAEALIMKALQSVGETDLLEKQRYSRYFQIELMRLAQQQGEIRQDIDATEIAKLISGAMVLSVLAWCKNPQPNALHPSMQQCLIAVLEGVQLTKGPRA